jgi:hypothetical protein
MHASIIYGDDGNDLHVLLHFPTLFLYLVDKYVVNSMMIM